MTLFESVGHFYRQWSNQHRGGLPRSSFWRFSSEGWRAYEIGEKKAGLFQDLVLDPSRTVNLFQFPVVIVEDTAFWYQLVISGQAAHIEGHYHSIKP